jgi:hypothetical protein
MHLGVKNYHIYSQTLVSAGGFFYAAYKIKWLAVKASHSLNEVHLQKNVLM